MQILRGVIAGILLFLGREVNFPGLSFASMPAFGGELQRIGNIGSQVGMQVLPCLAFRASGRGYRGFGVAIGLDEPID